jgi:hypothetical protein
LIFCEINGFELLSPADCIALWHKVQCLFVKLRMNE